MIQIDRCPSSSLSFHERNDSSHNGRDQEEEVKMITMDPMLQEMTILEEINLRDMIEAARDGRINQVKSFLMNENVNVNGKVFALDPALHEACYSGHRDVVELLLDHGADIEARTYLYDLLPLDAACIKQRISTVELLLERGARANAWGSLYKACIINHVYMLNLLLDHGAEINNNCNHLKSTPLHIACYGNSQDCVRELLHRGANLTMQNIYGETALDVARRMNHTVIFELMNVQRSQQLYYSAGNVYGRAATLGEARKMMVYQASSHHSNASTCRSLSRVYCPYPYK